MWNVSDTDEIKRGTEDKVRLLEIENYPYKLGKHK